MRPGPYEPLQHFLQPARHRCEPWRLILGIVGIYAIVTVIGQALVRISRVLRSDDDHNAFLETLTTGDTPGGLLMLLFTFAAIWIGVAIVTVLLHARPGLSLLGPLPLGWSQFLAVAKVLFMLHFVIQILPPWDAGVDLQANLAPATWLMLLPVSLFAILVQTSSEEVLFRGYLLQQLGARFSHPAVWLLLPAAIFAIGHYDGATFGENAWIIAVWAFCFGLAAADLTARAGTLGPAIAMHFVNNAWAFLAISLEGDLSGLSLFVIPGDAADPSLLRSLLPLEFGVLLLSWLTARLALRR